jgi:hypothetical protein
MCEPKSHALPLGYGIVAMTGFEPALSASQMRPEKPGFRTLLCKTKNPSFRDGFLYNRVHFAIPHNNTILPIYGGVAAVADVQIFFS